MKTNKYLLLLAFLPLLFFRDFTPDNELKYLSIADEAIRNGNIFTFTNHGEVYADKPPLYLWIVMLGKILFGAHSMLFLGLFSVIPALVIIYVMDKWVANVVDKKNRLTGQFMLISTAYFIGSAAVLRMDMLMCMFIVLSLYTFYQMYIGKGTKWSGILFPFYVFMAFFTKGPLGLLVPLFSVVVFLIIKKEIKTIGRYWGLKTWTFLLIGSAIWFIGVYQEAGYDYLYNLLVNQTLNRAVNSFHHKEPFYYYFEVIWYCLAPWSLLFIGVTIAGIKSKLIHTDLEKLFLTIIVVTFVMLTLFSSKLQIYMLPTFPFIAYLTLLLLQKMEIGKGISLLLAIPAAIISLVLPAVIVLKTLPSMDIPESPFIYIIAGILSISSIFSLVFLYKQKNLTKSINTLSVGILLTIFTSGFMVPSINKDLGYGELCKNGKELALRNGINSYYFYNLKRAQNMDVYLNQKPKELTEKDLNLQQYKNGILFLKTEDIKKHVFLQEIVHGKENKNIGKYSIVVL